MLYKIGFIVLAVATIAHASVFSPCEDGEEPVAVNVANCNEEYCEVRRNNPAKIDMTFKADKEEMGMKAAVHALIASRWIPWPLGSQSKVCENLIEGKCPVPANSKATYSFAINIPFIAPVGTRTTVELKVTDQDDEIVACTRFPILVAA